MIGPAKCNTSSHNTLQFELWYLTYVSRDLIRPGRSRQAVYWTGRFEKRCQQRRLAICLIVCGTRRDITSRRTIEWLETYHLCDSIRLIHVAMIFKRSRTVWVGSSLYFSSSWKGSTAANQNGNVAASFGGRP